MKETVDLYYLSPNTTGGWVTFTINLCDALRAAGYEPRIIKVRDEDKRSETKRRDFGYGEQYQNLLLRDALARHSEKRIIVAAAKNYASRTAALIDAGAALVVHDPTELKNLPERLPTERVVVIRAVSKEICPGATFIRHPYKIRDDRSSLFPDGNYPRPTRAITTCRVDFDKHTEIVLDANRLLESAGHADKKVVIRGFENRIFTRFKIVPKYPEWTQSKGHFERTRSAALDILTNADLSIDMSEIKGDGGGTQYSFLEAWEAGAAPIIYEKWIRRDAGGLMIADDMHPGQNCRVVANAETLAEEIQGIMYDEIRSIVSAGRAQLLENHSPVIIGEQYRAFLEVV